jgi:hypothetical protein
VKAYALFWRRCTKGMQNKIEGRTDFRVKIKDNPIELLKEIKEHSLGYQERRYNMSIIFDAIKTFMNTRQKEGESLQDYTKRFRVTKEVVESHLGGPSSSPRCCIKMKDILIYQLIPSIKKRMQSLKNKSMNNSMHWHI